MRFGRFLIGMVATGLAVELALIPVALFHFHKAGLYGVLANLVAIPLTTFVIMPLEAAALLLDVAGVGAPAWWLTGQAIGGLLALAHTVAETRGAVAAIAAVPPWAFGLMVAGGLWLLLWTSRIRLLGLIPLCIGAAGAALAPTPDLLVTGDGRHLALVKDGIPFLLRDRAGNYMRDLMAEAAGFDSDPGALADTSGAHCSRDSCVAQLQGEGRTWRVLATRSGTPIEWRDLVAACAQADIVVSDRWLPRGCTPRWLKLDRGTLSETGGAAIYLAATPQVRTVAERVRGHPWAQAPISAKRRRPKQEETGDAAIRDRTRNARRGAAGLGRPQGRVAGELLGASRARPRDPVGP
jgi:competence protein ComEC